MPLPKVTTQVFRGCVPAHPVIVRLFRVCWLVIKEGHARFNRSGKWCLELMGVECGLLVLVVCKCEWGWVELSNSESGECGRCGKCS